METMRSLLIQYRKMLRAFSKNTGISIGDAAELIRPRILKMFEDYLKEQEQKIIDSVPEPKTRKRRVTH